MSIICGKIHYNARNYYQVNNVTKLLHTQQDYDNVLRNKLVE